MRILGYIDHPVYKITVFKLDTRLSIKFEHVNLEQTFKFRSSEAWNSLREVQALVDEAFLEGVSKRFQEMEAQLNATFSRHLPPPSEDEFDEII